MKILAPVTLTLLALAVASPALAKTSFNKGQQLCKAAISAQTPKPKSFRLDADATTSNDAVLNFLFRVTNADGTTGKIACTVDRQENAASLAAAQ
jgi:hypothetical protein